MQIDNMVRELGTLVGPSFVETGPEAILNAGFKPDMKPAILVFPGSQDEVCRVVAWASDNRTPIVPFGGGTRLDQVLTPFDGGIGLSLSRLNRILELEADNLSVTVEAGLTNEALQEILRPENLFLPVWPDFPASTIGGEVAGNFSSWKRYRYGSLADYVLGVTCVTPRGQVVRTGGKTVKNASGYDLTKLLSGSWGTMGVITSLILKLKPLPEKEAVVSAAFSSPDEAVRAAGRILAARTVLSSLNIFSDGPTGGLRWALCLEGSREAVASHLDLARRILGDSARVLEDAEGLAAFRTGYLQVRRFLKGAGNSTAVIDKRLTEKMIPVLKLLAETKAAYDFDPAAGVLEFSLPGQEQLPQPDFLARWKPLADQMAGGIQTTFDRAAGHPVLEKLVSRIDPLGLMFPANVFLKDVHRG